MRYFPQAQKFSQEKIFHKSVQTREKCENLHPTKLTGYMVYDLCEQKGVSLLCTTDEPIYIHVHGVVVIRGEGEESDIKELKSSQD